MATHNDLGKKGEAFAISYLQEKEYVILEQNYRYLKAEVDIIAQKGNDLIAVEVKTRSSLSFGNPQDFVNKKKIQLLVKAMDYYVINNDLDVEVRFDIIAIHQAADKMHIEHLEDAFLYF